MKILNFTCNHIINEMTYVEDATVYHIYFVQVQLFWYKCIFSIIFLNLDYIQWNVRYLVNHVGIIFYKP